MKRSTATAFERGYQQHPKHLKLKTFAGQKTINAYSRTIHKSKSVLTLRFYHEQIMSIDILISELALRLHMTGQPNLIPCWKRF